MKLYKEAHYSERVYHPSYDAQTKVNEDGSHKLKEASEEQCLEGQLVV